ncbi:MAG TPA: type II secretion system protein [Fervidobacterium sp.]|nr:type II secretion system protein [Fervidobacterium sp.]
MRKGFTLVELLIVLAVIAALMAVATPMALNAVKTAKASQVAQNLNALKSAVEQYVYSEKELPKSEASLTNYMSKIPDGYTVTPDAPFVKGEATVTVAYTVGDILPVDVNKQYSEATKVTLPSSSLEHPGVYVKVRQWW